MTISNTPSHNPFTIGFNIGFTMPESGTATLSLTNPKGMIIQESLVKAEKGYNTYAFDTYACQDEDLEPGLYFLSLHSEFLSQTVKILKH